MTTIPHLGVGQTPKFKVRYYAMVRVAQLVVEAGWFGLVGLMYVHMPNIFISLLPLIPREAAWPLMLFVVVVPLCALVAAVRLSRLHQEAVERLFLQLHRF